MPKLDQTYLLNHKTPEAVSDKQEGPCSFLCLLLTIRSIGPGIAGSPLLAAGAETRYSRTAQRTDEG